ncbi:helix-turn-helix domain-containing protein [Kitasatospora sp. A2-31]|uniref:helix-turn-helix domain-containing protein n=1 Tax=Kitasatospora sp. A2-31 TaxID=2916414 RepID=UPI001EEBB8A5|nr:helix-turn-helix transcriptional regulator [Kitasatospora sp. A2-31]MCG6497633.1 helix-turn-helix transcriptional regulator [Kitasatospora sp. A2-31]
MSDPIIRERRIPPTALGPMLLVARARAGFSQSALARQVGVTPAYVAKLEHSTRCPSRGVAEQLADVLGLGADERVLLLSAAVGDAGRNHPYRCAAA